LRKEDFREYSEETDGLEVAWYDPESEDWVDDMLSCYLERVGVRGPHDVTWDFGKYQENHECPLERDFAGSLYTGDSESFLCAWKTDRKSTRLNSSHVKISYAVFCLKK